MLEYRRAWQAKALNDNTLLDATNKWIDQTIQSFAEQNLIARPQFIRRPQRSETMQLLIARGSKLTGMAVQHESDLHKLDLVNTELPEVAGPHYFVCTNAKRDVCCAKFGRPTFAALHRAIPDRAWQTTHVGGHRYAPNVLTLPQAALYGRVMADDVPQFLASTEQNQLARKFLRGQTSYSKVAQVGEQLLASQLAANSAAPSDATHNPAELRLLRETERSATFATPDGVREVIVTPDDKPLRLLPSCGKSYDLVYPLIGQMSDP